MHDTHSTQDHRHISAKARCMVSKTMEMDGPVKRLQEPGKEVSGIKQVWGSMVECLMAIEDIGSKGCRPENH